MKKIEFNRLQRQKDLIFGFALLIVPDGDYASFVAHRYDFTRSGSNGIAGLAWASRMCTNLSVTIVEDHFNFDIITVAAHELGHRSLKIHVYQLYSLK